MNTINKQSTIYSINSLKIITFIVTVMNYFGVEYFKFYKHAGIQLLFKSQLKGGFP